MNMQTYIGFGTGNEFVLVGFDHEELGIDGWSGTARGNHLADSRAPQTDRERHILQAATFAKARVVCAACRKMLASDVRERCGQCGGDPLEVIGASLAVQLPNERIQSYRGEIACLREHSMRWLNETIRQKEAQARAGF
jgi:hypothetical protein